MKLNLNKNHINIFYNIIFFVCFFTHFFIFYSNKKLDKERQEVYIQLLDLSERIEFLKNDIAKNYIYYSKDTSENLINKYIEEHKILHEKTNIILICYYINNLLIILNFIIFLLIVISDFSIK